MSNQPQANQPSKPIIVDDKAEEAKKAEAAKTANTSSVKPADAKSGNA